MLIKNTKNKMKDLVKHLYESLNEAEESIKSEKDFRDYAENKFKEAFGDELDENRMKFTIDGFLKDNKDLVDDGKWGELIGKFNESFASSGEKE